MCASIYVCMASIYSDYYSDEDVNRKRKKEMSESKQGGKDCNQHDELLITLILNILFCHQPFQHEQKWID